MMASVATMFDDGHQLNVVPTAVGKVQHLIDDDYSGLNVNGRSVSMNLPNEIIQQIYHHLSPAGFNAARHTCRSWFLASLQRSLLVQMLKRGGWRSSILQLLTPLTVTRLLNLDQEKIMSKWVARECALSSLKKSAFKEVGYTDFSGLVPGSTAGALHGAIAFTVSLCGRFLLAVHGVAVVVYELNHVCSSPRSRWKLPLQQRSGMPLGVLRPVTTILCPQRVISCSMDTSAGRYAIALLLEGRIGMVCDIMAERMGTSKPTSTNTSHNSSGPGTPGSSNRTPTRCICQESLISQEPAIEDGPRSIYRGICHADDPPRSVALCPQRNCVAFGCSSGIELHWVDALSGQDLSRWFPLTTPSDYLYFLPARKGVDTAKKLRLISSAAVLGNDLGPAGNIFDGFQRNGLESMGTAVVSVMDTVGGLERTPGGSRTLGDLSSRQSWLRPRDLLDHDIPNRPALRRVSASAADHYRAIPLGDGYHILFTDPKTGNLCLGTDAPVGALNRLIRKVWFRPPAAATSPQPLLYAAGSDTRHGVRVAATFAVNSGEWLRLEAAGDPPSKTDSGDKQIIAFYTIPPDMFHDISRVGTVTAPPRKLVLGAEEESGEEVSEWVSWRPEEKYHEIDIFSDPFRDSSVYPLETQGQPVAICCNLVELALDSGPDVMLWAFSAEGWARTWALETGRQGVFSHTAVQHDGSLRHVDPDGDFVMAGVERLDVSDVKLAPFDGATSTHMPPPRPSPSVERYRRLLTGWDGGRMSGTVSVDLVEEVSGIARMDVELR